MTNREKLPFKELFFLGNLNMLTEIGGHKNSWGKYEHAMLLWLIFVSGWVSESLMSTVWLPKSTVTVAIEGYILDQVPFIKINRLLMYPLTIVEKYMAQSLHIGLY